MGQVHAFLGNVGICLRALACLRRIGGPGVRAAAGAAVLNANCLLASLRSDYDVPFYRTCLHECLITASRQLRHGVGARDIRKRLMDYGVHPPNVSLPSTVAEPLLIEPTETESRASLDAYVTAMRSIAAEVAVDPDTVRRAPHHTVVRRVQMPERSGVEQLRWRR